MKTYFERGRRAVGVCRPQLFSLHLDASAEDVSDKMDLEEYDEYYD